MSEPFDWLLAHCLDTVFIGAKVTDQDWTKLLEAETDVEVYRPEDPPINPAAESGVVFAYTNDTYQFGMENVLLQEVAGAVVGKDLPVDYGWVVQNTETLYNVYRALADGAPVLEKYVHVDGYLSDGSRVPHRVFEAPIGTSAEELLAAAGVDPATLGRDRTLVDGGPGWCFAVQRPADWYGVTKRNCLMLLEDQLIDDHTYDNGRINVMEPLAWDHDNPATEPSRIDPDRVHIPIVTNETYGDTVAASEPIVEFGDRVTRGEKKSPDGSGTAMHSACLITRLSTAWCQT